MLKNGCINFKSVRTKILPCHVIIFSNCIPSVKEVSPSKWKIIKILKDGEAHIGHVTEESEIEYDKNYIIN